MKFNALRTGYIALKLTADCRRQLLEQFPPTFSDVIADHITWAFGVPGDTSLPQIQRVEAIGLAQGDGIEALVVEVNGTVHRPDGRIFHCTWSLDRVRGLKPVDSNRLLAHGQWDVLPRPIPMEAVAEMVFAPNS